jgi:hypothetical protein
MCRQARKCLFGELLWNVLACRSFEEMLRQGRQVLQMFGERRCLDAKDGESIKEICAEAASCARPASG